MTIDGPGRKRDGTAPISMSHTAIGVLMTSLVIVSPQPVHATADGCAVVLKTPDGFLSVREGPGTRFRVLTEVHRGETLLIDTAQCGAIRGRTVCDSSMAWTHVTSVPRIDGPVRSAAAISCAGLFAPPRFPRVCLGHLTKSAHCSHQSQIARSFRMIRSKSGETRKWSNGWDLPKLRSCTSEAPGLKRRSSSLP